ncbi:DMT family transporter [Desulforamulus aquiferis]|uniref:DMT family transporter n=1 Tax=Desulforamulus aquiferis TaxID=1397668 RepID=A0AAW7ZFD9_9FIRM|nr:DMT family transporter [Desulforamulus aquiferis]MDO7788180.1 DMT family transporter [Desulforamulus aquiferis]
MSLRGDVDKSFIYIQKKPYLLLVLATLFWGGNFVVARNLLQIVPPFHLSIMRLGVAFLLFLPFAWSEWKEHKSLILKHWRIIVLFSVTGIAAFNALLYVALQSTTSINASLVNSTAPMLIVILSAIFLKDRLFKLQYLGIVMSFTGVIWVISRGSIYWFANLHFNKGDLLVILAVIFWAIYSILMKKWGEQLPQKATFLTTLFLGFIILLPFFFWESTQSSFSYQELSLGMWLAVFYIGFFPSVVSFLCWNYGVISVGPSKASNFLHLIVIFSGLFALFIGETYSLVQFSGAVIIISGVLIVSNHHLIQRFYNCKSSDI